MHRYLVQRLLQLFPTLLIASILVFVIIQAAPGDPAAMRLGTEATQQQLEAERARLGLDRPLPVRYLIWLSDVATLQLGRSIYTNRPVTRMVMDAFPNTLRLALSALAISIAFGFILGIAAALRQNSPIDSLVTGFNSLGLAIPSFWLGILLILLFSVYLRWLPPSGIGDPSKGLLHMLSYLIMPVISVAISNLSVFSRFLRSAMIDVLSSDYIRTARSKGLFESSVVWRHALKNAMIPVVTIVGIQFGRLLGGAVVVEAVFAYPGMGRLAVTGILNRDYPVVQAVLLLVVLIFLLANLIVDLTYGYLDPRVTFESAK